MLLTKTTENYALKSFHLFFFQILLRLLEGIQVFE